MNGDPPVGCPDEEDEERFGAGWRSKPEEVEAAAAGVDAAAREEEWWCDGWA
jgi:hypothetical protein